MSFILKLIHFSLFSLFYFSYLEKCKILFESESINMYWLFLYTYFLKMWCYWIFSFSRYKLWFFFSPLRKHVRISTLLSQTIVTCTVLTITTWQETYSLYSTESSGLVWSLLWITRYLEVSLQWSGSVIIEYTWTQLFRKSRILVRSSPQKLCFSDGLRWYLRIYLSQNIYPWVFICYLFASLTLKMT